MVLKIVIVEYTVAEGSISHLIQWVAYEYENSLIFLYYGKFARFLYYGKCMGISESLVYFFHMINGPKQL